MKQLTLTALVLALLISAPHALAAGKGPTSVIDSPADGSTYYVNQQVVFNGHGSPSDPATYSYAWYANRNCSGSPVTTSRTFTTSFATAAKNVQYCLKVTDASGSGTQSVSFDVTDQGPDLTVSALSAAPASPTAGAFTTFTATVSNSGTADTGGTDFTNLFQYATQSDGSDAIDIATAPVTTNLRSGNTTDVSAYYAFATPGTFYIRACADKASATDTGAISELDETNNCSAWTAITVAPTTLTANECRQPETCNTTGTYTWSNNNISGTNCTKTIAARNGVTLADNASVSISNSNTSSYTGTLTLTCKYGTIVESNPSCTPANTCVANQGASCTSPANSCGMTNSGTVNCDGTCSASAPSDSVCGNTCVANQGASCTSPANSCGMTNSGTVNCDGTCSAAVPSNSLCSAAPACGSANGQPTLNAPTTNLCSSGTASAISSGNNYTWTCTSGTSVSCSAQNLSACTWKSDGAYCASGRDYGADCTGHGVQDGAAYTGGPYYACSFYAGGNQACASEGSPGVSRDFTLSCPGAVQAHTCNVGDPCSNYQYCTCQDAVCQAVGPGYGVISCDSSTGTLKKSCAGTLQRVCTI